MNSNKIINDQLSKKFDPALVNDLLKYYKVIKQEILKGDWEKTILNCGKFCEVSSKMLLWLSESNISSYKDVGTTCTRIKNLIPGKIDESLRMRMTRVIESVYDIRTHRGAAHHKTIDPNRIDAALCSNACDWILSEFIRLYHTSNLNEIKEIIEILHEKKIPLVEEFDEESRILVEDLSAKEGLLLLLYNFHPRRINRDYIKRSLHNFSEQNVITSINNSSRLNLIYENESGVVLTKKGINYVEFKYKEELLTS